MTTVPREEEQCSRDLEVPKADHHPCLTALEICKWRQGGTLPSSVSQRLLHNLATGCAECWRAIDEAREMPPADVLPTDVLEIRMLWSLTIYPEESRYATHRDALRQARTEPLGVFRLLVEEVLDLDSFQCPDVVIAQGQYVKTLLGDDLPADSFERRIWHDLHAHLDSATTKAWAKNGEHANAAIDLNRAVLSCFLGLGSAAPEQRNHDAFINMLIARASCGFYQKVDTAFWLADFEEALALLPGEDDEPRRLKVLNELACRLVEDGESGEAHKRYLEAACIAGKHGEDYPLLRLTVLHNLHRLEWRLAEEGKKDPPNFGLFFNLALWHYNQAGPLYAEWGDPAVMAQAKATVTELLLEAKHWAATSGLRAKWQCLQEMESPNPLHGLDLLGLATVIGDGAFVEEHLEAVRAGFAVFGEARDRLGDFHQELLALRQRIDEGAGVVVIDPFIEAVARVEAVAAAAEMGGAE